MRILKTTKDTIAALIFDGCWQLAHNSQKLAIAHCLSYNLLLSIRSHP
jgi:hypothetical protein